MTTLIPKFDFKNGGATPAGAVNRDINFKLAEIVSVKDFGATGDGTTDDTVFIQNAIDFVQTNGGGDVYFPNGTYRITAPLVIDGGANLIGDNATINNQSLTEHAVEAGTDPTVFNGFTSTIQNITFTGSSSGAGTCHGVLIQAMPVFIRDCKFNTLKGSGIRGLYAQYARVENCAFTGLGRYGIEITTASISEASNDIHIFDIYENIDNGLGGIFFQGNQSLIERCTHTTTDAAKTTASQLLLEGYNNTVNACTFELESVGGGKVSVRVSSTAGIQNTISDSIFQSSYTNRAVEIATGSSSVNFNNNVFNYIAGTTGTAGYIVKVDAETVVTLANNSFTDVTFNQPTGGGSPMVGSVAGPYNIFVQNPLKSRRNGLVTTSGTGPYFYTYGMLRLPNYGYYRIMLIAGGNGDSYQNHRGVRTAYVYYYPGSTIISYFNNDGTYQGIGNELNIEINDLDNNGLITMIASNDFSGTQSFTVYATQLASTE